MQTIIKEKYFELIMEYEKTELSLLKNKSKLIVKNENEFVRHLSYYWKEGNYDSQSTRLK